MTTERNVQPQIEGLATLLVLDDETRKLSSLREFSFFTTNETHRLIPYHTAWLWQKDFAGQPAILNQSGTAQIDHTAPINQWIKGKIRRCAQNEHSLEIFQSELDADDTTTTREFAEILPSHFLWCPLLNEAEKLSGGLLLFRETPFSEQEVRMLRWLLASYQYTWLVLTRKTVFSPLQKIREKKIISTLLILLAAAMFFPIHLSVLGSATVEARDPVLINAPMQGVIKSMVVSPGDHVKAGALLFSLDKTDLESDRNVSIKEMLLTQSKLRTAIDQEFVGNGEGQNGQSSSAEVPVLQSQLDIDKAHIEYTEAMLQKADVKSPQDGIAVFNSKEDWIGQPVQTGERILVVANPEKVQLKIDMPVTNAIRVEPGATGEFFIYGQLTSLPFHIKTIGYNARLTPSKILAYPLEADFTEKKNVPQLGAEGTARIYGHRVPLVYYLFRRPLQILRQSLGI